MPGLTRHPADARGRDEKSLSSPMTWAGWIPALGRNDEERERRPRGTLWPYLLELIRHTEIHRIGDDVGLQR
ncbi:hypothetical protein, partial [Agrobacterium pusense]|uniref:hypothetical protein n=1 Tax=Agrobacterium pusense TaxID=648995 RepID=UPI0028AF6763